MEEHINKAPNAPNSLDVNELLKSYRFKKEVRSINFLLGVMDESIQQDISQACAIAVIHSAARYDETKNDNFWGFAQKRMYEYAKNELNLQKDVVHRPYNRTNSGFKGYENIKFTYTGYTYENGDEMPFVYTSSDRCALMDINNAIMSLEPTARAIVELRAGIRSTDNGKTDFISIGETLSIPSHKVRNIFIESKDKLERFLNE